MKTKSILKEPEVRRENVLKALKKGPLSIDALAMSLKVSKKAAQRAVDSLISRGGMIYITANGWYDLKDSSLLEPGESLVKGEKEYWTHRFGFTTDNHLCNRHARLDVLRSAYDHFAAEGIKIVYNAGNWIDGECKFNKTELITAPGLDSQIDYFIQNFPQRNGIETHFIAGDDHEGWYQQREGIEVGKHLQLTAQSLGRNDLKYLGYAEADVKLIFGVGASVMRIVHPGGGSSYAISYTDQKRVESYQGGEKPQIELVGHYHKFNYGYPREVHTLQGGTTMDQSLFMRKKKLQAHVGYSTVKIKQDEYGAITRFSVDWFPHYDRGYYEKRYK